MRVISGKYKGRVIRMPKGIRPTQGKVRKALFDILGDIEGRSFLELFAGSGAIGIEAASRGIGDLALVEDNQACLRAIKETLESLSLKGCDLYPMPAQDAIEAFYKKGRKFDIIFMDPPYYGASAKKTLQSLSLYDILCGIALVVVQHFKKDELPSREGNLILYRQARYGDTILSFYKRE